MRYVILAMALSIVGCGVTLAETLDEQVVRLFEEGKYAEAEPLALQALKVSHKQNGPDHPDTATSLNNLASLYDTQGKPILGSFDIARQPWPLRRQAFVCNSHSSTERECCSQSGIRGWRQTVSLVLYRPALHHSQKPTRHPVKNAWWLGSQLRA